MLKTLTHTGYLALVLALLAKPALAYIGPGAGITMLSALWGVVLAIVLAIAAVLFWPIRALLRSRKRKADGPGDEPAVTNATTAGDPPR